ncbi:uncharacterized protein Z520_11344 [Fonsecaea multimorphosa CBS 102226]|uniref:Uncharacterized protein n=1 Tax=Fonsecaea multimorphosa CBS 102226 TaxID=1442371 RepID=A0A0D2K940_9EURO|nr:uncharacterized protein Z520_11344 [Fonsecaea multimorphosa CBS 102226]KIX92868.1 hypothetical protein Z520_11344 [Fonsecaea multimorphosa CBS 102226]
MERMAQRQWRHSAPNLRNLTVPHIGEIADAPTAPSWPANSYMSAPWGTSSMHSLSVPTLSSPSSRFPQAPYQTVPTHVPQTPVLRPTQFLQGGIGYPHQHDFGVAQAGQEGISPTNTVSTYELSSPKGFSVTFAPAAQFNVLDAMNQLHISQPHEAYMQPSSIPITALEQRHFPLSQLPSMLDHQSAAFRLEKARKGRGQRSC